MRGLENIIPLDLLLMMEPEELGAKLLFFLRNKKNAPYHFGNEISSLWANSNLPGQTSPYPQQKRSEINLAISEAWAWLVAQGLLVANPDSHGNEWMVLSRRASKFEDESEVASFMIARLLPKEALHRSITK